MGAQAWNKLTGRMRNLGNMNIFPSVILVAPLAFVLLNLLAAPVFVPLFPPFAAPEAPAGWEG